MRADTLGNSIETELSWDDEPPAPQAAAVAAGLSLTPEVAMVQSRELVASKSNGTRHLAAL